nr:MAG TPA: hypothetical protein [Caudoviricetes sp.]
MQPESGKGKIYRLYFSISCQKMQYIRSAQL